MSAKNGSPIRIGCGRYDWYFEPGAACRVEKLVIAIEVMKIFPATDLVASMNWLTSLPYPWCTPEEAVRAVPAIDGFAEIEAYLKKALPILPER
jgi:hypothetical protein